MVMVTHDNHLASFGDRIIHISDGKILKIEDEKMSKATGISMYNAGKSRVNHFLNMSSIGSDIGGNIGTGIGNIINTGKELFN